MLANRLYIIESTRGEGDSAGVRLGLSLYVVSFWEEGEGARTSCRHRGFAVDLL